MPRGNIDQGSSTESNIEPLAKQRLKNIVLEKAFAFRQTSDLENGDGKTRTKLALYFNTRKPIKLENGDFIDRFIVDGFVTLSGHHLGNLYPILKALGFDKKEYFRKDGSYQVEQAMEFGKNKQGRDFEGKEFEDLPEYFRGQKKSDIEVPLTMWEIEGISVIGRHLDMDIDVKNGWNYVDTYMRSDSPAPLEVTNNASNLQVVDDTPESQPKPETASRDAKVQAVIEKVEKLFVAVPLPQGHAPYFIEAVIGEEPSNSDWRNLEPKQIVAIGTALNEVRKGEKKLEDIYTVPAKADDELNFDDLDFSEEDDANDINEADLPF